MIINEFDADMISGNLIFNSMSMSKNSVHSTLIIIYTLWVQIKI